MEECEICVVHEEEKEKEKRREKNEEFYGQHVVRADHVLNINGCIIAMSNYAFRIGNNAGCSAVRALIGRLRLSPRFKKFFFSSRQLRLPIPLPLPVSAPSVCVAYLQ